MSTNDPAQEYRRLVEHYATLPDESLLQLAADRASLTEAANQALTEEMNRRNLQAVPPQPPEPTAPPAPLIEENGVVTIKQFRDLPAALFAKGALDSAGIECWLIDENMVRLDWFISNLLGGIKLQVHAEDSDAALEILNQEIPDGFDVEGVGPYEQPRCPKCGSVDITFEAINKPLAYGSAYLSIPLPIPRNVWKCEACGVEWKEVDEPDETGEIKQY